MSEQLENIEEASSFASNEEEKKEDVEAMRVLNIGQSVSVMA